MNKGELDKSGGAQMRASCAAQMVKNGHISKWPKNVFQNVLGPYAFYSI